MNTMPLPKLNILKIKNLASLLKLEVGDQVRIKEGSQRTAVVLDWKTVDNWWEGIITEVSLSEEDVYECRLSLTPDRIIPKGTPTFRIAPRGKNIKFSYLRTPGYLRDVKEGRSLAYWNKEKHHVMKHGIWIYPEDGDRVVLKK